MYRRTFALLIGVLALAAIAAGCGGDDDNTSSLTKAEFVKQGDTICRKANKAGREELGKYLKENSDGGFPSKDQEEELVTTVVAPQLAKQVDGLNDLGIPESDKGEIAEFVAELEDVVKEAEEDPKATVSGGQPFTDSERMATALGFKECGHN